MGLALQRVCSVVRLFAIAVALVVQGSAGYNISPSPTIFSANPPFEGSPGLVTNGKASNAPSPASQRNGSVLHPSPMVPPDKSAPVPETSKGTVPSLSPSTPTVFPPYSSVPPSLTVHGIVLSLPPNASQREAPKNNNPVSVPIAPVPVASPSSAHPIMPGSMPPSPNQKKAPDKKAPLSVPIAPVPLASSPPSETPNRFSPVNPSRRKAPSVHKASRHTYNSSPLSSPKSPPDMGAHSPTSPPSTSFYRHHHTSPAPSSLLLPSPASGPIIPPASLYPPKSHPKSRQRHHAPPPVNQVSPSHSPFSSSNNHISSVPSPFATAPSGETTMPVPFLSPNTSPGSSPRNPKMPPLVPPIQALQPPPPNEDCSSLSCTEPLTNTPPGSPCGCVWPMQVGLHLSVALYTFFPLVSELAKEIAAGVFMKQSQVRIMGANAGSHDPDKTIVHIDLVPLGEKFDNMTAYLTFQRFWQKQLVIKTSLFGDYEVLYVRYPGLPPSPPSGINVIDGEPYSGRGNNGRTRQPLGVDVKTGQHKFGLSRSIIAIIVLSVTVAVILCCALGWVFLFKHRDCQREPIPLDTLPSLSKASGIAPSIFGSGPTSASLSFASSIATFAGSAKTFSPSDIEIATDNFNASRIIGEGGFGRVYSGVLEDGTKVAVKVLKRDDQQGGREFLAEVEMLSRLHHRNLVKLIGICTEERSRCLVYELIPNGSVESHLHGIDKETAQLDWGERLKIAVGAARGLAYLHEDSSPRVIHRDFKSSNILLEYDFTPKVSDFGLARTAMDEENRHISTRVMGTFGYVAPEYAMTGHLLVKSDVYSYGVVLLELLTGKKPVDMSQPPGQENLVTWARPLLTSKEGLESIIDPSLGPDFPFDSIAKVAAIASTCVQPEVSHRPFMGEVVQALKLVCNECDVTRELGSGSCSQENISIDMDGRISTNSGQLRDPLKTQSPVSDYDSGFDLERGLSMSDLLSASARLGMRDSRSFMSHSTSGPLRTGKGKRLWQKMRRLAGGSVSEHGATFRLWPGSH
ncbi:unnamed protein product [Camellia sinensis]